jgi:hypothetical protein
MGKDVLKEETVFIDLSSEETKQIVSRDNVVRE